MTTLLVSILCGRPAAAQLAGQSFEVIPQASNATVGDTVTLQFRIRLHERDKLLDTIPQLVSAPPPGVRILSVEKLSRTRDRVFQGRARIAFYRPGRRQVPTFGLTFMRVVEGVPRATLPSDSAFVQIASVLHAGNPELKDIKALELTPGSRLFPLALVLTLIAGALVYRLIRRRGPAPLAPEPEISVPPAVREPYQTALEQLDRVAQARWPAHGEVARHYEATVEVLREYLEEAEKVGARERTTSELLWALPPHLTADGLRTMCHEVLAEADLVKFAEVRPSGASAADFLKRARSLLDAWHRAVPAQESVHALR